MLIATLHRRAVLTLATGFAAHSFFNSTAFSAVQSEPPKGGPLGVDAVSLLLRQHNVPGASLAVIENGELVATYGYGTAQGRIAVSPGTRFQAASISKTVNALAVLKLVQAGRIGLDDPVNRHLKSWKLLDNALTARTAVTVRMLLSHTGGTNVHGFGGYARDARLPTVPEILDGHKPANSPPVHVVKPPGQGATYSGGGSMVLQQMVMDVTGEFYGVALSRIVLEPLGMNESGFRQQLAEQAIEQVAFGHNDDGRPVPGGFHLYPEQAAAGLWTTPRDLSKALIAIMRSHSGQTGSFLDQRLAQAMLTRVSGNVGLGTFLGDGGAFFHSGVNAGFQALYSAHPVRRRGRVAMTNGSKGGAVCGELFRRANQVYA